MTRLGFEGCGKVGTRMARHLSQTGHSVALWSATSGNAETLASLGAATVCASHAEVPGANEFGFLCVGDTVMLREVRFHDAVLENFAGSEGSEASSGSPSG